MTLILTFLLVIASVPAEHINLTDKTQTTHFSLDSMAEAIFEIENTTPSDIDVSPFAVVALKDRNGVEYTAPFDIATLTPTRSGPIHGLMLKPHTPITARPDLSKLLWGKPKADVVVPQAIKAIIQPGEYTLSFFLVCTSCKPIMQTSKPRKVKFF